MFFKLDEFNVHVTGCKGSQNNHYTSTPVQRNKGGSSSSVSNTTNSDNESYSATGRPMRNCVKEVTYRDEPEIEPLEERTYEKYEKGAYLK